VAEEGQHVREDGAPVGVVVAAGLMRLMTSVLYRVSPLDMPTYVGVSAVLLVSAMVASYLPARRAAAWTRRKRCPRSDRVLRD
jgi:ABC-type lipoprotein release transport system permease subunit